MVLSNYFRPVLSALPVMGLATALLAPAHAQTLRDRMDDTYERLLSKYGIEVGGGVSSEYFNSGLSGSAVVDTNYSFETNQFTSFDLDMRYRPYDYLGARALVRFYQDWQTFFATRSRILATRWLSVDGNIANTLGFNVGDFRQNYSPLTLWSPELELVYEPEIFSRGRELLMEEQFLEGNQRVLQGANLNFARRFDMPLSEFRLDAIGSRLRRGEFLDPDGAQGLKFAKSDMDRFLLAVNSEAFLMDNLFLGGTYLTMLDDRDSYRLNAYSPGTVEGFRSIGNPLPAGFSLNNDSSVIARELNITSGRGGVDLAGFLGNTELTLEVLGEYALSSEANRFAWHYRIDSSGGIPRNVNFEVAAPGKDGKAMNLELGAGYQPTDSGFALRMTANYIDNQASFLNPMAQSPTFMGARIMNTENDLGASTLYSSFDALNNGVYKFSPSRKTTGFHQAPFSKTSYNNGIFSPEDLENFRPDPVLQLVMPFGPATPNRKGFQVQLGGHLANTLHVTGSAAMLKEGEGVMLDSVTRAPLASFAQYGAGIKFEAARLLGLTHPLDLTASVVTSASTRDPLPGELVSPNIDTRLIMAGFHYQFLKKWALLAGIQQATLKLPVRELSGKARDTTVYYALDDLESDIRVGLEYSLGRQAYLMVSGGLIEVKRTFSHQGDSPAGTGRDPSRDIRNDFSQTLSQALIRVKF